MKKNLAKAAKIILCLPIILLMIYIILSIVFMGINRAAAENQTQNAVKAMSGAGAEIIDTASFSGNSSGTGNHVDLLSLIAVRTKSPSALESCCDMVLTPEEYGNFYHTGTASVSLPDDTDNCYIAVICKSAPFPDNIEGH